VPVARAAEALAGLEAAAVGLVAALPVLLLARGGAVPDLAAAQACAGDVQSAARRAMSGLELRRAPLEFFHGLDGLEMASLSGGGLHEHLSALGVFGTAVLAVHAAVAKVVQGGGVTSPGGFLPPPHRQRVVLLTSRGRSSL